MSASPTVCNQTTGEIEIDQPATLETLCAESGWAFTRRSGQCMVKLDVNRAGPPFYAHLHLDESGVINAWVELAATESLDEENAPQSLACAQAVEAMLAEVTSRITFVRGTSRPGPTGTAAVFEATLAAPATGLQLADVLCALSVACELAGPEIRLLQDNAQLAAIFLAKTQMRP